MYELILRGEINLAITNEILSEYAEVLDYFFKSQTLGELITKVINRGHKKRLSIIILD